jgi:hypothetical protein
MSVSLRIGVGGPPAAGVAAYGVLPDSDGDDDEFDTPNEERPIMSGDMFSASPFGNKSKKAVRVGVGRSQLLPLEAEDDEDEDEGEEGAGDEGVGDQDEEDEEEDEDEDEDEEEDEEEEEEEDGEEEDEEEDEEGDEEDEEDEEDETQAETEKFQTETANPEGEEEESALVGNVFTKVQDVIFPNSLEGSYAEELQKYFDSVERAAVNNIVTKKTVDSVVAVIDRAYGDAKMLENASKAHRNTLLTLRSDLLSPFLSEKFSFLWLKRTSDPSTAEVPLERWRVWKMAKVLSAKSKDKGASLRI